MTIDIEGKKYNLLKYLGSTFRITSRILLKTTVKRA